MNTIEILGLREKIQKFEGQQIKDVAFKNLVQGTATKFYSKELEAYKFSIGATGEIRAELYNSADDEDEHGVIGGILPLNNNHGFIKYIADGSTKLIGNLSATAGSFNLLQQNSTVYSIYKAHSLHEQITQAIEADLSRFISVLDLAESQEALAVGEATALHVDGQLEAKVSLAYSDVFLSSLSGLSKLLDRNELIRIQFKPDIVLDFNVAISDTFSVVFYRNAQNQYTVLVKKADIKQFGGSLKAGVQVEFANPDQVIPVLNDLLEKLLEVSEGKIDELLSKSKVADLTKSQKDLLEVLLDRLGLEQVTDSIGALKAKYAELKEKVKQTIDEVAIASVELGFSYEYQRISTKNVLFQGKFDKEALRKYHFDLLRGNLKGIVESHQNGNPDHIKVEHYLQEYQQKRKKAWGFSLGFASTSRTEEIEKTKRTNIHGKEQIAFSGFKRHEDTFFGNKTSWLVDFNVEMPAFSAHEIPLANEFNYSLYLAMEWKDKKLKRKEDLLKYLDQGVLWRAIPPGEMMRLAEELYPKMKNDTLTVTSQLKISAFAFKDILNRIRIFNERKDILGMALGAAMDYDQDHEVKRSVEMRSRYYGEVWEHYLKHPIHGNENYYVTIAHNALKPVSPDLAKRERKPGKAARQETVWLTNNTDDRLRQFKKGIHRLQMGLEQPTPYTDVIEQAYREIRAFWSKPLYTRALGYYLLFVASQGTSLLDEIERIFTISYQGEGGKEEIINLTTSV